MRPHAKTYPGAARDFSRVLSKRTMIAVATALWAVPFIAKTRVRLDRPQAASYKTA
jgi:hypothetical protein